MWNVIKFVEVADSLRYEPNFVIKGLSEDTGCPFCSRLDFICFVHSIPDPSEDGYIGTLMGGLIV